MPTYKITDPKSGKVLRVTGDSPPTEQELEQIFASVGGAASAPPTTAPASATPADGPQDGPGDFLANAAIGIPRNIYAGLDAAGKALLPPSVATSVGTRTRDGQRQETPDTSGFGIVNAGRAMLDAQNAVKAGADDAWAKGDYTTAIRKYADWLLPIIGPPIDAMADKAQAGQPWGAAGDAVAFGVSMDLPASARAVGLRRPGVSIPAAVKPSTNPVTADAVRFAEQNNIPVDAGTVTDSPLVKNAQKRTAGTIGGAAPIERFQAEKDAGLTRTGQTLADRVHPNPQTPETAGAALRTETEARVSSLKKDADTAYGNLRAIEHQNPAAMAVDVTAAQQALKPMYDALRRQAELGVPMQGGKGRVLTALDGLMNAPNTVSVTDLDMALSDLKDMARTDGMPELRTKGQNAAAAIIPKLEAELQAAVARGGPAAVKALQEGRAAYKDMRQVGDVLDTLKAEPVGSYKSAVARADTQIEKLRALERVAPNAVPKVARAWLDDALSKATEAGRFDHADKLYADWQNLGDATKAKLFGPSLTKELDNFFTLAKKLNENPNPSGTANVLGVNMTQVLAYLPAKAMARVLYSPAGVRLLTQGLNIAAKQPANVAGLASVLKAAARASGVALDSALVASRSGLSASPVPRGDAPIDPEAERPNR